MDSSLFLFSPEVGYKALNDLNYIQENIQGRVALGPGKAQVLVTAIMESGGDYVETGTLFGGSAILAALANEKGHIYTIDPHGQVKPDARTGLVPSANIARNNFETFNLEDRITLLEMSSYSPETWYDPRLVGKRFSVAFIDGDHTYKGARNDWYTLKERVEKYIIFDNYDVNHEGVVEAVSFAMRDDLCWVPVFIGYGMAVLRKSL